MVATVLQDEHSPAAAPRQTPTALVRSRMPLLIHRRRVIESADGRVIEHEWLVTTRRRFAEILLVTAGPQWEVTPIGRVFVHAERHIF
jgi:hypothetical protein